MKRRINLSEVTAKEPIKVDTEIQPSILELPEGEAIPASPFKLHVEVRKKSVGYEVSGKIEGEVELSCSRCLKRFKERIDKDFRYEIMPTSELTGGEIKKGDLDIKFSDEGVLDLAEVVQEQILLSLPVKPICSEECEEVSFSVGEVPVGGGRDARWSKLKELRDKLREKEK
ncbi:MAG: YceD family protein [Desulfurobacteriaceae bacterium]